MVFALCTRWPWLYWKLLWNWGVGPKTAGPLLNMAKLDFFISFSLLFLCSKGRRRKWLNLYYNKRDQWHSLYVCLFFIICFTLKKGGEGDDWTIIVKLKTDCITFVCFFFLIILLYSSRKGGVGNDRRTSDIKKVISPMLCVLQQQ